MRPKPRCPIAIAAALAGVIVLAPAGAEAARCGNGPGGFKAWVAGFKREAAARGISRRIADSALNGVTYNSRVIRLDRTQRRTFKKSFKAFAATRVTRGRIARGKRLMRRHGRLLARIERHYGVPPAVVVAIWGMETDFGANMGRMNALRALATLAYDCRRSAFFTNELMSALKIIQRGDLSVRAMRGAWAGELGQTQFLASSYLRFAVDFDGNGRRDLIRSTADALGSTANYLRGYGWRRGAGWRPGQPNFRVLAGWNKSTNYQKAIALFASHLAVR